MLAYVFWHRPAVSVAPAEYEAANLRFQRSLAAHAPGGFHGSACLRAVELPWLGDGGPGYEDWYLVEDFAALGVLNEAAVGRGPKTAHDAAARLSREGSAGIYRMLDGSASLEQVAFASWIAPPWGDHQLLLDDFFADEIDPQQASLWRRQLALGPGAELCLLTATLPEGLSGQRLPAHWHVDIGIRAAL